MRNKKLTAMMMAAAVASMAIPVQAEETKGLTFSTEVEVPEEIDLYTYYAENAVVVIDETLERLKEIYPDLTINIEHRTDADGEVLKTRASIGELPDMFECTGSLTNVFSKSGDIAMLDDVIEDCGYMDKYVDTAFQGRMSEDGHYYAIADNSVQTFLIYYNKEVFEEVGLEAPTNYDELKNCVTVLKENDIIPLALFGQEKWPGLQLYDLAVIGSGEPLGVGGLDEGLTSITDEAYVKAAEKMEELVSLGMIGSGALNTNASQAFELMATGQAGMLGIGSWFFDEMEAKGYDHVDYCTSNPFADAGNEEAVAGHMSGGFGSVGGWAVNANGEHAEFCKQLLMNFLYIQSQVQAERGVIGNLKETIEPKEPRGEAFQYFADHIGEVKSFSKFEYTMNNLELKMALEDAAELMNTGSYTAEDFISDLAEQMEDFE